MEKLESAQLQVLKEIRKATDAHTGIQVDEVDGIILFLKGNHLIAQESGGWKITEEGRLHLEQAQNVKKREHTGKVQGWLSVAISGTALVVSILALLSK